MTNAPTQWIPDLLEVVNGVSNRNHIPIIIFPPKDQMLYRYCQYHKFSVSSGTKGWNLCQESESDGPNAPVCTSVGYEAFCLSAGFVSVSVVEFLLEPKISVAIMEKRKKTNLFSFLSVLSQVHYRLISFAAYNLQIINFQGFCIFWIKRNCPERRVFFGLLLWVGRARCWQPSVERSERKMPEWEMRLQIRQDNS